MLPVCALMWQRFSEHQAAPDAQAAPNKHTLGSGIDSAQIARPAKMPLAWWEWKATSKAPGFQRSGKRVA